MVKHNMGKEKETKKHFLVGVSWNFSSELKIVFMALLLFCTFAILLQFIPSSFSLSASDLRFCIFRISTAAAALPPEVPPEASPEVQSDQVLPNGVIKRSFNGYGWAAYNFISMSAYRGGTNTFAVIGLSSKPLHVYGQPSYTCEWVPRAENQSRISANGQKILPDWGYGRIYTVVVVNCTFPCDAVNSDNSGGTLFLHASTGDVDRNATDTIKTLVENPGSVDFPLYNSTLLTRRRPKYDYLYCGSSLYGNLSPQRVREWIAYHVRLFGNRSHFVLHDAGGIHDEVMEVLKPWMELGFVTVHDIRDQERFDGYYHNQFMVVNDCLHRYRFTTQWMFFFDVDEFIYVPTGNTFASVMKSMEDYSQFTIEQMPMSSQLCFSGDGPARTYRKWGFEKLAYRDVKKVARRDRKYAVQPRNVYATGVHMSQHVQGKTYHRAESKIRYFHYHGSISQRREPCRQLSNATQITFQNAPYVLDTTLRDIGLAVKTFELKMVGDRLIRTRQ